MWQICTEGDFPGFWVDFDVQVAWWSYGVIRRRHYYNHYVIVIDVIYNLGLSLGVTQVNVTNQVEVVTSFHATSYGNLAGAGFRPAAQFAEVNAASLSIQKVHSFIPVVHFDCVDCFGSCFSVAKEVLVGKSFSELLVSGVVRVGAYLGYIISH